MKEKFETEEISVDTVYSDLLKLRKKLIISHTLVYFVIFGMVVIITVICYFAMKLSPPAPDRAVAAVVIECFLIIASIAILCYYVYLCIWGYLSCSYYEDFTVVTDSLTDITEEPFFRREITIWKMVVYFNMSGKVALRADQKSKVKESSIGDTFYLVKVHGKILNLYNAKIYRFVDTDNEDISSGFSTTTK